VIAPLQTFAGLAIFYTIVHLESELTLKKVTSREGEYR